MSGYKFLASDQPVKEVKNPYIQFLSINEALERGIEVGDFLLEEDIDRGDTSVILHCDSEKHFYEIEITKEEPPCCAQEYSKRKYYGVLEWEYSDRRAQQLIGYIKEFLGTADSIELWDIWMGDREKPVISKCHVSELTVDKIKKLFGKESFERVECLRVDGYEKS